METLLAILAILAAAALLAAGLFHFAAPIIHAVMTAL